MAASTDGTTVVAVTTATYLVDAQGAVWTLTTDGKIAVNGVTDSTTGRVVKLVVSGGKVWQQNADNNWWSKAKAADAWVGGTTAGPSATPAPTPTPTPSPTPTPTPSASGLLSVSNGKLVGPDGKPFIAAGINIGSPGVADQMLKLFPGMTWVRVALGNYDDPNNWADFIAKMTAAKIVTEIEHHPWPLPNAYAGAQLTAESAWYAKFATKYKNAPYVVFGSMNEPQDGDLSAQHAATYNAIRGVGANNLVVFQGGAGGGNPGMTGKGYLNAAVYTKMKNVAFSVHCYGWIVNKDPNQDINAKLLGAANTQTGFRSLTAIPTADGVPAVMVDEFGLNTSGGPLVNGKPVWDNNYQQVVTAVTDWSISNGVSSGYAGWHWDADPSNALQSGGQLTDWGRILAARIKATAARTP